MEPRLVPLNAVIALLRGHGGWPTPFDGDGLDVRWLEVPVTTSKGLVTVDVLAYSSKRDLLVPAEVKSGANADEEQAGKYAAMTAEDVLRLSAQRSQGLMRGVVGVEQRGTTSTARSARRCGLTRDNAPSC